MNLYQPSVKRPPFLKHKKPMKPNAEGPSQEEAVKPEEKKENIEAQQ